MLDYFKMTDTELVMMSRNGDASAEEFLMKKYSRLVRKEIRFLFIMGADSDDLLQEGMIGLVKAIRGYVPENNASFSTFATVCVRRQIRTAITSYNRKKHSPLNTYVSFYSGEDEGADMIDIMCESDIDNPEKIVLAEEKRNEIYKDIEEKLSDMEKDILRLYLRGLSYSDISMETGKNEKAVNNALTRIRLKLKERKPEN
ncbi:RNA polymerase sporulation-specific sigma factor [Eubacterium ruminantium]|uniref:RNA polymerase sporulation-specific sigma factor n=3 Tax=Eubacterium ruminantium TaxID=42322 RepID=A0A1T4PCB0_9FIRM|nr:sigma-70 family RNA polymerase sigma factor [Eubacterium ruminantium]SCW58255.1 RNA polymerase sporulation-specific sigma factor [Eubacterium ruminantium]SDM99569.1 RNA polymerase, sigma 30 subunit, SigH [Eubacterium ruminantium]SJZ88977.1 RNA polymerase sporulation-specific sigma factor [Eubacterium ruminantium]